MPRSAFPGPVPRGAIDYIRNKDLRPGFHYQDVWGAEHAHAFTVAKMMKLDLLADTQESLAQALEQGQTFREWSKQIRPELERRGWWGVKEEIDPKTGEKHQVQLGSARRLRTIYNANMRAARAAGQWQRIQRNKSTHPWLLYQLGPSVHHRPQHVAWEGTLLPVDDPFWSEAYPPSGYGCKCWVKVVSHHEHSNLVQNGYQDPLAPQEIDPQTGLPTGRKVRRNKPVNTSRPLLRYRMFTNKRTGEIRRVPVGVTPAWEGNTGANRLAVLRQGLSGKLDAADQQLAHAAVRTVVRSPILPQYLNEARVGDTPSAQVGDLPIGFVSPALKKRLGADTQLVRLTQEAVQADPELDVSRLDVLDELLQNGHADSAGIHTVVAGDVAGRHWQAVLDADGKRIDLVSLKPVKTAP